MKAHLMYRDRDFDLLRPLPENQADLTADLGLGVLFAAMAGGDEFLFEVARRVVLSGLQEDAETVRYRQAVLGDCLRHPETVRRVYDVTVEAIEGRKKHWLGLFSDRYPSSILSGSVALVRMLMELLGRLKAIGAEHAGEFESEGFNAFFGTIATELPGDYFAAIREHLEELELRGGGLFSARLGKGNQGEDYILRKSAASKPGWIGRLFSRRASAYTFHLDPRDEIGARALSELEDRGLNPAANAVAQSGDHILSFFTLLRTELAFYLGCSNAQGLVERKGAPTCFPVPFPPGTRRHACSGLRDVGLVLSLDHETVGNELDADGKDLVVVTGANQGGKSTFLRGIGMAQLMMQCGMFVAAESFGADLCRSLFTHYRREEDAAMKSGKFDEEMARMSAIADQLTPDSLLLFNESFAATNEREGSEVARQIVQALLETRVKIFFVTHLHEFAHGLWEDRRPATLFLRAERREDGRRTFKLPPGDPLETSYGADVYREIFGEEAAPGEADSPPRADPSPARRGGSPNR
ncbi:MAG: MutS-related protein [Opitutaceae bacterium]